MVLVRNEARNKFESRWFGPYKIVKKLTLDTYRLAEPNGDLLKNLINERRLFPANIREEKVKEFWNFLKI
jgi:hypothetical protein